jgi:hypothetical protein
LASLIGVAFVATNVDDIFVLLGFYAVPDCRPPRDVAHLSDLSRKGSGIRRSECAGREQAP